MAVGSFTVGDIDRPYVMGDLWNGKSWSLIPMPGPQGASTGGDVVSVGGGRIGQYTVREVLADHGHSGWRE
jgi:uncharacterized protein involved in type VI secretion and phage assembly